MAISAIKISILHKLEKCKQLTTNIQQKIKAKIQNLLIKFW